jgi:hypothetical protein
MAPLLRTPQKNYINFSDEIFNAIKASTNNAPILPQDVEALVKDLRYILEVVRKEGAALHVQQWQDCQTCCLIFSCHLAFLTCSMHRP